MQDLRKWHNNVIGERVVQELQRNNFDAVYFENREDALTYIKDNIPSYATIGVGGSATTRELGLIAYLQEKGHTIFDHNAPGLQPEQKMEQRRKQLTSDLFISGTNAITLKGELVNRDGIGNRVAAMSFGPQKVIIVAGINKVVKDIDEGLQRINFHAAPLNSKRHELATPCVQTGQCGDCRSVNRICNITSIIHKCPPLTKISVVLIGESLGY